MWRDVPRDALAAFTGQRPLSDVKSWHYQLDKVDIDVMGKRDVDMLVTDYAREGGKTPLSHDAVARLKLKPDGTRRIVISYLSIGEAEEFRYYWNTAWKSEKPSWLERENCAWPESMDGALLGSRMARNNHIWSRFILEAHCRRRL